MWFCLSVSILNTKNKNQPVNYYVAVDIDFLAFTQYLRTTGLNTMKSMLLQYTATRNHTLLHSVFFFFV